MENYIPTLNYNHGDRCVPIPYSERELQSVVAEPFVKVSDKQSDLEGVCFDKTGKTMYFVNCPENHVCSLDMETKQIKVLCEVNKYAPGTWIASVKVHKDSRLFVPYFTLDHKDGGIFLSILTEADLRKWKPQKDWLPMIFHLTQKEVCI